MDNIFVRHKSVWKTLAKFFFLKFAVDCERRSLPKSSKRRRLPSFWWPLKLKNPKLSFHITGANNKPLLSMAVNAFSNLYSWRVLVIPTGASTEYTCGTWIKFVSRGVCKKQTMMFEYVWISFCEAKHLIIFWRDVILLISHTTAPCQLSRGWSCLSEISFLTTPSNLTNNLEQQSL